MFAAIVANPPRFSIVRQENSQAGRNVVVQRFISELVEAFSPHGETVVLKIKAIQQ